MDTNHPIPQDVTGFQFRLIGDMTVKQFAYVAVGGIFTIISLYAPIPFLLRIPFMILFAGAGVAVAFFPIEGRPMDLMIGNFLKALFSPNQYLYQKTGGQIAIFGLQSGSTTQRPSLQTSHPAIKTDEKRKAQLQEYLTSIHGQDLSNADKKESVFMNQLFQNASPVISSVPHSQPSVVSQPVQNTEKHQEEKKQKELSEKKEDVSQMIQKTSMTGSSPQEKDASLTLQENVLSKELADVKNDEEIEKDLAKKQQVHLHAQELEKQLEDIKNQKDALEAQISALQSQMNTQTPTPRPQIAPAATVGSSLVHEQTVQQPPAPEAPQQVVSTRTQEPAIRKIPSEMAKSVGIPHMPEAPNLIMGIIKDARDNVLSNILVEVKDKDGTPARAFRTNQLGQFASATQLSNGTYTIEFEDPKGEHQFDLVEINANGEIIMPLEVISHDAREELRKALFN